MCLSIWTEERRNLSEQQRSKIENLHIFVWMFLNFVCKIRFLWMIRHDLCDKVRKLTFRIPNLKGYLLMLNRKSQEKYEASSEPRVNEWIRIRMCFVVYCFEFEHTANTHLRMLLASLWNGLIRNQIEISVQNVRSWSWQDHVMLLMKVAKVSDSIHVQITLVYMNETVWGLIAFTDDWIHESFIVLFFIERKCFSHCVRTNVNMALLI